MKLPKKITPCPIVDCLVELRFTSNMPADAIFGIVYNAIKTNFPNYESLPILQLPEPVRRNDPNLKYKPYYKMSNNNIVLHIGPDVMSISSFPDYLGWDSFKNEITDFLSTIQLLQIVEKVHRIGLRVINFFPKIEIFSNSKFSIMLNEEQINLDNSLFRTVFDHGNSFKSTLNISNDSNMNMTPGSFIDIDTFYDNTEIFTSDNILPLVENIHSHEKELFFSLLTDQYLQTFKTEY